MVKNISYSIYKAYEVAKRDLRKNYGESGIYAGPKNHHEYWGRDSFFASYGALALGDYHIVKKNLDLFSEYQKPIGHIPLRIEERFHTLAYLGLDVRHKELKAIFKPSQFWANQVIDSNPLYLISASEYVKRSKDYYWMKKNSRHIMNAVSWLVGNFDERNLIQEGVNANWADFTFKSGNVLYTNILVWRAFHLLCKTLPTDGMNYCFDLSTQMEKSINDYLWDEEKGYFIDRIGYGGNKYTAFSSDGNLMAIFLGFASKEKGRRIMEFIDNNNLDKVPVPIYFPHISGKGYLLNRLIFPNYNTKYTFLWWGSISAVCRMKLDDRDGALKDLRSLAKIIIKYKAVPEIVDDKGNLVNRKFYKTELAAAWSAGMYVYAVSLAMKKGII